MIPVELIKKQVIQELENDSEFRRWFAKIILDDEEIIKYVRSKIC